MTITLTQHDRKLLMERLETAEKMERPDEVVTVIHVTEIYVGQDYE